MKAVRCSQRVPINILDYKTIKASLGSAIKIKGSTVTWNFACRSREEEILLSPSLLIGEVAIRATVFYSVVPNFKETLSAHF